MNEQEFIERLEALEEQLRQINEAAAKVSTEQQGWKAVADRLDAIESRRAHKQAQWDEMESMIETLSERVEETRRENEQAQRALAMMLVASGEPDAAASVETNGHENALTTTD